MSNNARYQGADGVDLNSGSRLTESLTNLCNPADFGSRGEKARSDQGMDVEGSPPFAPVILQQVAKVQDGGGIELAIVAPGPAAASGDSRLGEESSLGDAAQRLSDIRPESGVGLFCDIEVAVAPSMPISTDLTSTTPHQDDGSLVVHQRKARAELPSTELSQSTTAGLAGHLPLILCATVLVSRGALHLEEKVSRRDRRLQCIQDLRQSPSR
jgi:hypothetical protein